MKENSKTQKMFTHMESKTFKEDKQASTQTTHFPLDFTHCVTLNLTALN